MTGATVQQIGQQIGQQIVQQIGRSLAPASDSPMMAVRMPPDDRLGLAAHPELAAGFAARRRFAGGEGTSWLVDERAGARRRGLLLKLLDDGGASLEAGLLDSLRHPRIPAVLEVGRSAAGRAFVLRDFVPGDTLAGLPAPEAAQALDVTGRLLELLAFVHARGVLHLDLKPANVVIAAARGDDPGGPTLLDFGLAQRRDGGDRAGRGGTPFFAAPERLLGLEPDPRSDLFSLGATLIAWMLPSVAGRARDLLAHFPNVGFLEALGLRPADLPEPFDRLVPRLVARSPRQRFADAIEALEALGRRTGSGRPTTASLALDPASVHAATLDAALQALPAGSDLLLRGGDAAERAAVALQLACRADGVRRIDARADETRIVRAGEGPRIVVLQPLGDDVLAAHLRAALRLDAAVADRAAAALLREGATTASAAGAALAARVARGQLVPDGPQWTWPEALAGRLDRSPPPPRIEHPRDVADLASRGRIEAAFEAYRRRARAAPAAEPRWREALARGLVRAGEPLRALPLSHDLPALRGRCLLDLGRLDDARAALATARADDERRRVEAGIAHEQGAFAEGLRALEPADAAEPHNRIVRACLLTALGRVDEAATELDAALHELPAETEPFARAAASLARGELARRRAAFDVARRCHADALALFRGLGNVRHTASAWSNLGVVLKDLGRHDDARDALRRARALYEHAGDRSAAMVAEANLGIAQLAAGDARSAIERFDRVIPGLRALGVLRSDRLLRALRARALAISGDAPRARAELADLDGESAASEDLDPRIGEALDAARALLHADPQPTNPNRSEAAMTDDRAGIPRTVFRTFLAVNRRLASETDLPTAMQHLLEAAETVTGARAGYLLVERDGVVQLEVASRLGVVGDRAFSRSLVNKAIIEQRTMSAEDAVADRELMSMPSVMDLRQRSALCAPFRTASGGSGALYVEHPNRRAAFGAFEAEYLEALADQAAIAVDRMLREEQLAQALASTRQQLAVVTRRRGKGGVRLIGQSPAIDQLHRQIDRFARSDLPILVQGATGTGKELVARLVHERSGRAAGNFVSENCSAIPADLMEAELFGHVKGSFTGADEDRPGLLELASGGTLLLDEVGDMMPEMQVKLLRALQEQSVRRIGGREPIPIDVRLVTATHRDLRERIAAGAFREDLYFRIAAGVIHVPPLRERGDDVVLLAEHFVDRLNQQHRRAVRIDDATKARLLGYAFPGNVRELEHLIARTYLLTEGSTLRLIDDLPGQDREAAQGGPWPALTLAEASYRTIHAALRETQGDKTAAARLLGISRTALYDKLRREGAREPEA